jgi:hypothetical protein
MAIYFDNENNMCFYENGIENKIKLNKVQNEVFLEHINANKTKAISYASVVDYCDRSIKQMSITM